MKKILILTIICFYLFISVNGDAVYEFGERAFQKVGQKNKILILKNYQKKKKKVQKFWKNNKY